MNKAPFETLGLQPSFGFGDRIGLATPGHAAAMRAEGRGIAPIFAQQSIREMSRTARSPAQGVSEALEGMRRAGWSDKSGADADHLKTHADVDATAAAGFVFFTIDPSDHVDPMADSYREEELASRLSQNRPVIPWIPQYVGKHVELSNGRSFTIDALAANRCAVKYGRAIEHAIDMAKYIATVTAAAGQKSEIELSIDETPHPTSLAEHFIIADQCRQRYVCLISLAPRFVGEFEKGIDYKGNLNQLEQSLNDHAELARILGPYKLSLHSGSDKLSLYPILARATRGCFHVKTAGTSYLEALRVVARYDAPLFRRIVDFSRRCYDRDKATYHVSAKVADLPSADEITDAAQLERIYLGHWSEVPTDCGFTSPGRQVLHCTFGSVLSDRELGVLIRQLLLAQPAAYLEVLADHFGRHLRALRAGL
jgi:hypothetical protein